METHEATAPAGLSIAEFARQVGISRATVYLLEDQFKPETVKIGRRSVVCERPADWLRRVAAAGGVKMRRAAA